VPPLSIMLWLPLACGVLGAILSLALGRSEARPGEDGGERRAGAGEDGGEGPASPEEDGAEGPTGTGEGGDLLATQQARRLSVPGALALVGSIAALGLAIAYIADFNPRSAGLQDVTDVVWISELGIHYKLAISGLNVFLVGLTTLLFAAATLAANLRSWERPRLFYFHFMLAESAVLGAFLAQDLALFVAFFDLMLIPFYFLIGGWGREPGRVKATIKVVIYTLTGSLLMLAGAIATGVLASQHAGAHITFVLSSLQALPLGKGSQEWIFLFFAAAFLVKMPAFPLHGWMPDGYRAMPIEVLMVFSGVLAKVGA
jgi:NADH-quinone oxidoreductase subunit M